MTDGELRSRESESSETSAGAGALVSEDSDSRLRGGCDVSDGRRIPGLGLVAAVLLIAAPVAAVAWWLYRPKPEAAAPAPPLTELDVVCLGRVDGLAPVASLEPTVPGKVVKVSVSEGDAVKQDQELLRLDDTAANLRVEEAMAALAAAETDVEAARLDAKLQPNRVAAQQAAVNAAADRVAAAERLHEERSKQQSFGQVTAAELAASASEVKQLKQLKVAEEARLKELTAADPGLRVRAAEARKATAEVALKQAKKAVADCVLKAPSAGVVLRVQASPGEAVAPGTLQPPIVFRPDGPLVVRAELDQEFLGRVRPGMKATVRDEARADSPTWMGKVLRVGNWVARKRSVVLEPGEVNDVRTVECVVALDGPADGLLVGQRVRVRLGKGE